MTDVAVIGVGQTRYGMFPDRTLKDLFHEAAVEALSTIAELRGATIDQRLRIIAGKCDDCGRLAYPPRPVCTGCGGDKFTDTPLSGEGKIYTYSVVAGGGAPSEFDDEQIMTGDVLCGVVELREGPRVMVRLADAEPDDLRIGMKVRAVVRRLYDQEGIVRYGAKFVPAGEAR